MHKDTINLDDLKIVFYGAEATVEHIKTGIVVTEKSGKSPIKNVLKAYEQLKARIENNKSIKGNIYAYRTESALPLYRGIA